MQFTTQATEGAKIANCCFKGCAEGAVLLYNLSLKGKDEADYLLCRERKGLNELKQKLETLLRDTLTQLQV